MDYPRISIVTPSYNQGQFLEATIQSILSQNYPNLEYIIIDGGSTDNSVEIIQKYQDHLHFWCSEPDAGQYDAINKGFSHTTGEIMAWLNSDDLQFPWALRTVASILSELSEVEWLTTLRPGGWDWHGFCVDMIQIAGYSKQAFLDGRYVGANPNSLGWIQQESTFWRRGLWEKVGGHISTEFKLASDFDLWARFYQHAELVGTSSPLAGFRSQAQQKSRAIEKYTEEARYSLAQLRSQCHWKPQPYRELAFQLRLNQLPRLRTLVHPLYSYHGKQVIRQALDSPEGYWVLEEYSFA